MMLADTGLAKNDAYAQAQRFYLHTAIGSDPRFRPFLVNDTKGVFSPESKPFAARVLYPYLASLLYPRYSFGALIIVSLICYVFGALLQYGLLRLFCADWLAALGAICVFMTPLMRELGASALTDMMSIALWIAAILLGVSFVRKPRMIWLLLFGACCIGLALSRPAVYLPLGLALGALVAAMIRPDRLSTRSCGLLLVSAMAGAVVYFVASSLTNTPGIATHLQWLYKLALAGWFYANPRPLSDADRHSFWLWWFRDVGWVSVHAVAQALRQVLPAVLFLIAIVGLYKSRKMTEVSALIGALIAGLVGVLANPVLTEVPRLVETPAYPIIAVGVILFSLAFWPATNRHQESGVN